MNNEWLAIKQLDRQLKEWWAVSKKYGRPRFGWVKTVRVALSMSVEQLANRLGVTRGRVAQLENAEVRGAVTLHTLMEVADALDCEFVYAIIPKKPSGLEGIIKTRADQVAAERVATVAHSMSLEAQSVNQDQLKQQSADLAKKLLEHLNKKLWSNEDPSIKKLKEALKKGKGG